MPTTTSKQYSNGTLIINGQFDEVSLNGAGSLPMNTFRILAVGGGGGAPQATNPGAGGAGGMIDSTYTLAAGSYAVNIGVGGVGAQNGTNTTINGVINGQSNTMVAIGGGGGSASSRNNGGSGGGSGSSTTACGGLALQPSSAWGGFGFDGGRSSTATCCSSGGGGGGAGGVGQNAVSRFGTGIAAGGAGRVSNITGSCVTYAAGGYAIFRISGTLANSTANTYGGGANTAKGAGNAGTGNNGIVVFAYAGAQTASGGVVNTYSNSTGTFTAHIFTTNGTFTTVGNTAQKQYSNGSIAVAGQFDELILKYEVLIVGGGAGGGGAETAGGGGGGGVLYTSLTGLSTSATVVVGRGGAGGARGGGPSSGGSNGTNSSITILGTTYTAIGGGGGGSTSASSGGITSPGKDGGSGGGASGACAIFGVSTQTSTNCYIGYGNSGGTRRSGLRGGGGGGAGQAGISGVCGGKGGDGIPLAITGSTVYYGAGGGGGGCFNTSGANGGPGGTGGGGAGQKSSGGCAGTGIGSGGGGSGQGSGTGGAGSNGAVIITYAGAQTASGGTVTSFSNASGSYTVHTFTSNGTFQKTSAQRQYSNGTFAVAGQFDEVTSGTYDILAVGGGGGLTYRFASCPCLPGAGGGGVAYATNFKLCTGNSYNIVVGSGAPTHGGSYTDGTNSTFGNTSTVFMTGVYGGGTGRAGGSAGGGSSSALQPLQNQCYTKGSIVNYGNVGAGGLAPGGGGAGTIGGWGGNGLNGGDGIGIAITGTTVYYGAGGRGIRSLQSACRCALGYGGYGSGRNATYNSATNSGFNGVVIVAYPGAQTASGGTVTSFSNASGSYTVHTFTANGTFIP